LVLDEPTDADRTIQLDDVKVLMAEREYALLARYSCVLDTWRLPSHKVVYVTLKYASSSCG